LIIIEIQKLFKPCFYNRSMKAIKFVNELMRIERPVFTIEDAVRLINKPRPYVILYLHRLEKQELIKRIERGKYALKDANPFVIASNLVFPSYISLWMAFHIHHLTTQLPIIIEVVTSKQKLPLELDDYRIEFIKMKPKLIFGYRKTKSALGYMYLAEKEKALIDRLYLNRGPDLDDIRHALHECDLKKLEEYALQMNSKALIMRLGYLLEKEGLAAPESFKEAAYSKTILLTPSASREGEKNKKWHIIANYQFDTYGH